MLFRQFLHRVSFVVTVCLLLVTTTSAQNTPVQPGDWIIGRIDSSTPTSSFTLPVEEFSALQIRALSLTPGLNLDLSFASSGGSEIPPALVWTVSHADFAFDAAFDTTRTYLLTVSASSGGNPLVVSGGEFMLQVAETAFPIDAPPLAGMEEVVDAFSDVPANRIISFSHTCPVAISVANASETGAPFAVRISGLREQEYYGGLETRLIVPTGGEGSYFVEVKPLYAVFPARVRITAGCASEIPSQADALAALPPPLLAPTFAPPAGQLMIISAGGNIEYGQGFVGTIAEGAPLTTYSFEGRAGDVVTGEAIGLSPEMQLGIAILSPQTAPISYSAGLPFGFTSSEAAASVVLPEDGTYSLLVSSQGAGGAYLLRLTGGAPFTHDVLTVGQPFTVTNDTLLIAGTDPFRLSATAPEDCPSVFSITPQMPFRGYVALRDSSGQLVMGKRISYTNVALTVLPPNSGTYTVDVQADDTSQEISLTLDLSCIEDSAAYNPA